MFLLIDWRRRQTQRQPMKNATSHHNANAAAPTTHKTLPSVLMSCEVGLDPSAGEATIATATLPPGSRFREANIPSVVLVSSASLDSFISGPQIGQPYSSPQSVKSHKIPKDRRLYLGDCCSFYRPT